MSAAALPVGFRFHPTEEELVNHFLKKKMQGKDFDDIIPEIDILKWEPWDLPGLSPIQSDDDEWFYFSRPDYKFNNRKRANRATERGFWKITSRENEIIARQSKAVIGKKRTLTFYTGKVRSGKKTSWVIHEYYIPETLLPNNATQRDFVLCRLKKKDERTDNGACDEGEPSTNNTSDFENLFSEDLEIVLRENSGPEDFGTLFTPPESPHFSSMMREGFLNANAGSDRHLVLEAAFGDDESEVFVNSCLVDEDGYHLEERSRTTLLHHSSEPKSLSRVYVEDAHKQVMSSPVASSLVKTGQAQLQSGPRVQLRVDDFIAHRKVRTETGQSSVPYPIRISKPLKVKYTSKVPEKPKAPVPAPMEAPVRPPMARQREQGQSLEPPSNDEQKGVKQKQTGTTFSDWKGSFIVWKESPLSLKSYPPVVYISYMILGLFLFISFAGEVVSYGKW